MPSYRKKLPALAAGLALLATGLTVGTATSAQANPAGTGLVISEVYGGGGNSGADYTHDFIELYNPTAAAISVDDMSVQYRSSGGTSAQVTLLTGSVPAGRHYLVQQAEGSGGDTALPPPDESGTIAMAGGSGQVLLVDGTTASTVGTGDLAGNPDLVDMVGYGTAQSYETAPTGTALTSTTSASRNATGVDTDDNSLDFTKGALTPTNSTGSADPEPEPDPEPVEVTIPEIQGTGDESPLKGDPVITSGVVTAAYPSGGFFGFYMQTPGSGGETDLVTHTGSEGLFVYYPKGAGNITVESGDHVQVTGEVDEYAGLTQVRIADAATDVEVLTEPASAPVPVTVAWPRTDAQKESLEGMLYTPTDEFTVTNTYSTNQYGEVGLAQGTSPLIQPTEVADAESAEADAVAADNAARAITLDDASSTNFTANSYSASVCGTRPVPCLTNGDLTPPYISNDQPVRVGAAATFIDDVIFSEGGSPTSPTYRFQPTQTVVGPDNTESPATFENDRTVAPDEALLSEAGEPDLKVASFNVLNYFTTLGDPDNDNVGAGTCEAYTDRDGDGNNIRPSCDPRGAWDPQDLERQQEKIVAAINTLDADVIGLMEIENSAALGEAADEATNSLVDALNADAGSEVWAANPSSADLPPASEQDVITNAIIYRIASVDRVGPARALGELSGDGEAFSNAREPIAQGFVPAEGGESFLVVVNHFKSKGSGIDDGTGQGNANPDRVAQAEALRDWVPGVQEALGIEATLLIGDFNAYSKEDPLQVLYGAGYTNVEHASGNGEYSYSFGGQVGSLDHILANDAAMDDYTGVDVWNINSGESVALEYSRWNYHSTDFHDAGPYRSSDHDPVIMGLDLAVDVVKATPTMTVVKDKAHGKKGTRVKFTVEMSARGQDVTGKVRVERKDRTWTQRLKNERAKFKLGPFKRAGTYKFKITYLGSDLAKKVTKRIEITIRKPKKS